MFKLRLFCYLENGEEGQRFTYFDHYPSDGECELASDRFANACEDSARSVASSHGYDRL